MNPTRILVCTTHSEILATILRLINKEEAWLGEGSTNEAELVEMFWQKRYEIVLLGAGLSPQVEDRLSELFRQIQPNVSIIQHYGGGSGLLKAEIASALKGEEPFTKLVIENRDF